MSSSILWLPALRSINPLLFFILYTISGTTEVHLLAMQGRPGWVDLASVCVVVIA